MEERKLDYTYFCFLKKLPVYYFALVFVIFSYPYLYSQTPVNKAAVPGIKIFNEKNINTANLESSPAFVGDKIAFVYTDVKGKFFDQMIDEPFFELGYSMIDQGNELVSRQIYNKRINSELHEGPMAYDAHTNTLYFTRSHKETRKVKGLETDTFYLRIMSADLNAAKPTVAPINLNVDRFSVCHPALSTSGKTIFYSSNKPGGEGKMDLYVAYNNGDEWTGSITSGNSINTSSNEAFPYVYNDSLLIFASDRPGGPGGWDLYISALKNGSWSDAELLPAPFNSPFDDLGLIIRQNGKSGYFASNRPGGHGKDDIYRFQSELPVFGDDASEMVRTEIRVLDKLTLEPISKTKITLTPLAIDINNFTLSSYNVDMLSGRDPGDLVLKLSPKKGQSFPTFTTDDQGLSAFQIKKSQKYLVKMQAEGYNGASLIYDFNEFGSSFNMVLEPESTSTPEETEGSETVISDQDNNTEVINVPMEPGAVLVLESIYYDYNSSYIQPGAAKELDHLAQAMTENPNMKIRLESHTDSRGAAAYNLQLSIDRANAARNYLTQLGIDEDRITIRGYGESKLRNKCTDNVPCTEANHKYNRRTEVVIEQN